MSPWNARRIESVCKFSREKFARQCALCNVGVRNSRRSTQPIFYLNSFKLGKAENTNMIPSRIPERWTNKNATAVSPNRLICNRIKNFIHAMKENIVKACFFPEVSTQVWIPGAYFSRVGRCIYPGRRREHRLSLSNSPKFVSRRNCIGFKYFRLDFQ